MKLKNIRDIGRFINSDGKSVNIKKGTKVGYGVDIIFYLFRHKRVIINDKEFYECWTRVRDVA